MVRLLWMLEHDRGMMLSAQRHQPANLQDSTAKWQKVTLLVLFPQHAIPRLWQVLELCSSV
jgi:hypothetical protein